MVKFGPHAVLVLASNQAQLNMMNQQKCKHAHTVDIHLYIYIFIYIYTSIDYILSIYCRDSGWQKTRLSIPTMKYPPWLQCQGSVHGTLRWDPAAPNVSGRGCAWLSDRWRLNIHIHIHMYINKYIYVYTYAYVYIYMYVIMLVVDYRHKMIYRILEWIWNAVECRSWCRIFQW